MFGSADFPKTKWLVEAGTDAESHEVMDSIDIFKYKDGDPCMHFQHHNGAEILDWVNQHPSRKDITGGLRIAICERHRYDWLDFQIKQETFERIQTEFKLSPKTLQSFYSDAGTYSRSYRYDEAHAKATGIDIILKAPQKREIGNYGLSMHYDIKSRMTTALLYGTDILVCNELDKHPKFQFKQDMDAKTQFDYIHNITTKDGSAQEDRPGLRDMISSSIHMLESPFLLPCVILEDHMRKTQKYCEGEGVATAKWEILNSIGMRSDDYKDDDQKLFWYNAMDPKSLYSGTNREKREEAARVTAKIDREVLRILYTERPPTWNKECSEYMLRLPKELKKKTDSRVCDSQMPTELQDGLEYNILMSKSLSSRLRRMKEEMTTQLEVCASIAGQTSNQFNAQIAWDTSRDSTSMKILALITACFLPATSVATVFSMSMFEWRFQKGDGAEEGGKQPRVVSDRLWIYFAFAAPLTVLTLVGWAGWWIVELYLREKKILKEDTHFTRWLWNSFLENLKLVWDWIKKKVRKIWPATERELNSGECSSKDKKENAKKEGDAPSTNGDLIIPINDAHLQDGAGAQQL